MSVPRWTVEKHYDHLIAIGNDWSFDPPYVQGYMERMDGPRFDAALGDLRGRQVLDVGVGTGRIARRVLSAGCGRLTGIDLSSGALALCRNNLSAFANVELTQADICSFVRPDAFDIAYSVLTLLHVEDKALAISNIVASVRTGGRIVLSASCDCGSELDFGEHTVAMYPEDADEYRRLLAAAGATVVETVDLTDTWEHEGTRSDTFGQVVARLLVCQKL